MCLLLAAQREPGSGMSSRMQPWPLCYSCPPAVIAQLQRQEGDPNRDVPICYMVNLTARALRSPFGSKYDGMMHIRGESNNIARMNVDLQLQNCVRLSISSPRCWLSAWREHEFLSLTATYQTHAQCLEVDTFCSFLVGRWGRRKHSIPTVRRNTPPQLCSRFFSGPPRLAWFKF